MFPYRLRPPIYGAGRFAKFKEEQRRKQQEDKNKNNSSNSKDSCYEDEAFRPPENPYAEGGPLQRAVQLDLLELRNDFFKRRKVHPIIRPCSGSTTSQDRRKKKKESSFVGGIERARRPQKKGDGSNAYHCYKHCQSGSSFSAFRDDAFVAGKVTLLHTHYCPVRCDQGAYSQLLYAACLFLLKKEFAGGWSDNNNKEEEEETTSSDQQQGPLPPSLRLFVDRAAYAVFCLYALYETNPLPTAQSLTTSAAAPSSSADGDGHSPMAMMASGLQSQQNHRLTYRRSFRSNIRIDPEHYAYLLQLRDLARAVCADCQADAYRAEKSDVRARDASAGGAGGGAGAKTGSGNGAWKCYCSTAKDCLFILERLWKRLDPCAYTGPCGLEGLAGHADYPHPAERTANLAARKQHQQVSSTDAATATASSTNNKPQLQRQPLAASAAGEEGSANGVAGGQREGEEEIVLLQPPPSSSSSLSQPSPSTDKLQAQLKEYLSARNAIRLPVASGPSFASSSFSSPSSPHRPRRQLPPSTARRMREILAPMFKRKAKTSKEFGVAVISTAASEEEEEEEKRDDDFYYRLQLFLEKKPSGSPKQTQTKTRKRVVSFRREIVVNGGSRITRNDQVPKIEQGAGRDAVARPSIDEDMMREYELVLSNDISADLEQSLHSAVQTLVGRDASILQPPLPIPQVQTHEQTRQQQDDYDDDGVSAMSATTVAASAVGRSALDTLLARVHHSPKKMDRTQTAVGAGGITQNACRVHDGNNPDSPALLAGEQAREMIKTTGDLFLSADTRENERGANSRKNSGSDDLSDLSSEEDAVSIAASTAGRMALDQLLLSAGEGGPATNCNISKHKSRRKSTKGKPSAGKAMVTRSRTASKARGERNGADDVGEHNAVSLDASTITSGQISYKKNRKRKNPPRSGTVKRKSSKRQVQGQESDNKRDDDNISVAISAAGRRALDQLLLSATATSHDSDKNNGVS